MGFSQFHMTQVYSYAVWVGCVESPISVSNWIKGLGQMYKMFCINLLFCVQFWP